MVQHSSEAEIADLLRALGVTSLCQWEVLVFFYRHQATLLARADLVRLLGYTSNDIVIALDSLASRHLVVCSRVSRGTRLYEFNIPLGSPRGAVFVRLLALATYPAGVARVARVLRRGYTHQEAAHQAKRFTAKAQQRLQVIRQQVNELAARRRRARLDGVSRQSIAGTT